MVLNHYTFVVACPMGADYFNGTLRREVLNAEWFSTTRQAQTVINQWLKQYNHIRRHHALGMRPPIPETIFGKHQITGT
jgi:putative transposase